MSIEQSLLALNGAPSEEQRLALERFASLGLPRYRSEDYQRTDLAAMLHEPWELGAAECSCNAEELGLPQEVYIGELSSYAKGLPHLASPLDDALAQLVRGLSEGATLVHVPRGVRVEHPLELESFLMANGRVLSAQRLVLVLEAEARLEVLMRRRSVGEHISMSLESLEIHLGAGAELDYTDLGQTSAESRRISTLHLYQEAQSQAVINSLSLSGGRTRNNYYCDLQGEGAQLHLGGLVIGQGREHIDNSSFIRHSVPHCMSSELFKYALQGDSYGVFTGRIYVAPGAQKTEAYQTNRNLLLSPTARMQAKPQLEIYADDVKCSHGMTTGQLSEEALFYMQQRGLARSEARRLLSIAFSEDVLRYIRREPLRDALRDDIATRFT